MRANVIRIVFTVIIALDFSLQLPAQAPPSKPPSQAAVTPLKTIQVSSLPVRTVRFSPDGKTLAAGTGAGTEGEIVLFDSVSGAKRSTFKADGQVNALAFSPDGKTLATATGQADKFTSIGGGIVLWDVQAAKQVWWPGDPSAKAGGVASAEFAIAFSPDGNSLVAGGADEAATIYNIQDRTAKPVQLAVARRVRAVTYSPDGALLLTAGGSGNSGDGHLAIWDSRTGDLLRFLKGHILTVNSAAFSPDAALVASCSDDETLRLWDVKTGETTRKIDLRHQYSSIYNKYFPFAYRRGKAVEFSRDGKTLALSGTEDGMVSLWDVATGALLKILPGALDETLRHTKPATSLDFSPDGKTLASASEDGTVKLWAL